MNRCKRLQDAEVLSKISMKATRLRVARLFVPDTRGKSEHEDECYEEPGDSYKLWQI